ncbi:hypothetical protein GCM10009819_31130 [Agromyces tropicus]|uniref:Uncharacterized protein n=1 Tax=Agromyces tropicus TaxID=555371 RepID=A0ABP5GC36_9MICO
MIVQTNVVGSRTGVEEHVVDVPAERVSLRDLLVMLVDHELAVHERRRGERRVLRILTPSDLAEGAESGRYGSERRTAPRAPSPDLARARALEAFEDGLYYVFLDGRQVDRLDDVLEISPESTLRIVRLVALAGA